MRVALPVVVVIVTVVALVWFLQRRLIYLPGGPPPAVGQVLPDGQEVTLTTDDGLRLAAWYVDRGPTAVLVLPGNAGNRATRAPLAQALAAHDLSVLLVEYRGYGGNPGAPTASGLASDARAAARWVAGRDDVRTMVYLGESLGAGVAVRLATEQPPAALVLRSPFPSLGAVARLHYGPVPDALLRDEYPVAAQIDDLTVPVLVVVGAADRIVSPELSREVFSAAQEPKRWVSIPGAGHNDRALLDGDRFIDAVVGFLSDHGVLGG